MPGTAREKIDRILPPSIRRVLAERAGLRTVRKGSNGPDLTRYARDPVGYARDVLGITLTPDQTNALVAMHAPPYRVMVKSGHSIGKSFLAALSVNHWYDTRPDSLTITTAPTGRDVKDILWTEVRLQRRRARISLPMDFIGPSAPEMRSGDDHVAKGFTAATGESFQGRHRLNQLFVFDEAEGIDSLYWQTASTMFQPDGTNAWLAILNPTTTTSQSYQEERSVDVHGERKWQVFSVSSLNHPNIHAALRGERIPFPGAVTLEQVETWLADWFERIPSGQEDRMRDVEFPIGSGEWWRPSPIGEGRVLGRRPSAGTFGIWSELLWKLACRGADSPHPYPLTPGMGVVPQIGCDVARFGDDWTEMHVRCGPCSLHHEEANGWDVVKTANHLQFLAEQYAAFAGVWLPPNHAPIDPRKMPIKVDDTGVGGGVTDILKANKFNAVPINAAETAAMDEMYPRLRDELWFTTAEMARRGMLDLSRLDKRRLAKLENQALAPMWQPTVDGRRQVEPKKETKKRIGRSPDGMDALNLAYYDAGGFTQASWVEPVDTRTWRDRAGDGHKRRT